jgi:hypothetical protein
MRSTFAIGRSLVLMGAVVYTLSGCLGDNCRPGRGWDRSDHSRGGDHGCDRDRGRHHYY